MKVLFLFLLMLHKTNAAAGSFPCDSFKSTLKRKDDKSISCKKESTVSQELRCSREAKNFIYCHQIGFTKIIFKTWKQIPRGKVKQNAPSIHPISQVKTFSFSGAYQIVHLQLAMRHSSSRVKWKFHVNAQLTRTPKLSFGRSPDVRCFRVSPQQNLSSAST